MTLAIRRRVVVRKLRELMCPLSCLESMCALFLRFNERTQIDIVTKEAQKWSTQFSVNGIKYEFKGEVECMNENGIEKIENSEGLF